MKRVVLIILVLIGCGKINFAQESKTKHIIEIKQMKFIPAELTVKKGDTVVWVNRDFFTHDVAKFENKKWQSPPLKQDQSWLKVITKSEDYYCTFHVVMKGEIIVKD